MFFFSCLFYDLHELQSFRNYITTLKKKQSSPINEENSPYGRLALSANLLYFEPSTSYVPPNRNCRAKTLVSFHFTKMSRHEIRGNRLWSSDSVYSCINQYVIRALCIGHKPTQRYATHYRLFI